MKFSDYPFVRYTLFFMLGILLYPYLDFIERPQLMAATLCFLILYLILVLVDYSKKTYQLRAGFPLLAYSLLVLLGVMFTHLKDVKNNPSHLLFQPGAEGYLGLVLDHDQKKAKSWANRVAVKMVKKDNKFFPSTGEVIVYHTVSENLKPGEVIWISGTPPTIDPPKNPHEFGYQQFMSNQQIYHSHFIGTHVVQIGITNEQSIQRWVLKLRAVLLGRIDRYIEAPFSRQIAHALLLGQKKNLEKELSEAYITAGTMHVLAVSGLHVGILYGFFFLLIKPYRLSIAKRVVYLSILIGIIWLYALLTGMSPSVMRAATMFTLIGLAQMKSRNPSIFNTLALSALILLIFDPYILYSVGFQLSYLAVLGILIFQPWIRELWMPQNRIVFYLWEITTVGIAAQLATFPISAHYFHVFPTYFIFSNLIAIPAAFLIMSLGIPFLMLSYFEPVGRLLGSLLDQIIQAENRVIFLIQKLPFAKIDQINLSLLEMLLVWLLVIYTYLLVREAKKKYALYFLLILSVMLGYNWWHLWREGQRNELYIYEIGPGMAVDHYFHGRLYTHTEKVSLEDVFYKIIPNRIHRIPQKPMDLEFVEEKNMRYLILPGNSLLKINGQGFEVEAPFIKSVSRFENGNWKSLKKVADQPKMETAYKIVFN